MTFASVIASIAKQQSDEKRKNIDFDAQLPHERAVEDVQENKLDREKKAVDDMRETEEQDDSQQGWVEWITVHIFRNSFI